MTNRGVILMVLYVHHLARSRIAGALMRGSFLPYNNVILFSRDMQSLPYALEKIYSSLLTNHSPIHQDVPKILCFHIFTAIFQMTLHFLCGTTTSQRFHSWSALCLANCRNFSSSPSWLLAWRLAAPLNVWFWPVKVSNGGASPHEDTIVWC